MKKIKKGLLKRLKNVEGKNDEPLKAIEDQGEKLLKALESNADSANRKAFQSLKFLNRLGTKTKNDLIELRRQIRKLIIRSLPVCILTEKSSILTILEDQEILLEAFISVIFHGSMQLRGKRKWRTYLEV